MHVNSTTDDDAKAKLVRFLHSSMDKHGAQGHNTAAVGLEPRTSRSGVRHSTTEPPRSPMPFGVKTQK